MGVEGFQEKVVRGFGDNGGLISKFREMQRRNPGGLGGMPQRECCVRAGTQNGLSDPSEPRPVLDGVIWGDGSQHLPFFKTKPASCISKIFAFKKVNL